MRRDRLFSDNLARQLLGEVFRACFARYPLEVVAVVLLPDHLHTLWTLPAGDDRYSLRWRWIKREFTRQWLAEGGGEQRRSTSRVQQRRRGVWQRRFWEHMIRDDSDFEAHFDYIHYNPINHGLVQRPRDWPWSSFHRWARAGHYSIHWAGAAPMASLPHGAGE